MHYWISGSVLATLLLSGCSLWTSDSQTKENTRQLSDLQIPQGLTAPKKPSQFDIPSAVADGVRGEAVELRAPMQVLAVTTNARVEEDDKEVRVFFERNEFTGDLLPYLHTELQKFFQLNQIDITQTADLAFQTGWINQYEEAGWWFWSTSELTQKNQFQVLLEPKTHGRTVGIKVVMTGHQYQDSQQQITPIAQRREEVHFLNRMIDYLAGVELAKIREIKAKLPVVSLAKALNEQNEAVLLTTQPIDYTWNQLELLFEQVSLTVTDLNRNEYIYYVSYTKPESGFWNSLWGDTPSTELPIAEGDYQLLLTKTDKGTAIKWRDKNGQTLSESDVYAIYDVLVQAIQQAKLEL